MRITDLSFRYGRRAPWVLTDVSFELPPGTVAEVTGGNGAGKSTLLRLLAGAVPPGRGSITGRPPVVGYAPEIFPVEQAFTARAYLGHLAAVRDRPAAAMDLWAERLGLTDLLDTPLRDLSKGSAHKVGLVQALLAPPGLLVLDEPFSGLDERTRAELPLIAAEVAAAGGIVVVSDHQHGLAGHPGLLRLTVAAGTVTVTTFETGLVEARTLEARTTEPRTEAAAAAGLGAGRAAPAGEPDGEPVPHPRQAVVEVLVDAADAEAVVGKLRADGYQARLRAHTPSEGAS
ncbi:hypothetical protein Sru01_54850 [Sphaerisporangium rufum]|uniref:ABC transporter domain-containing protein n=1 Tax=Sphaerisporangium rufum TaxID=1381558 RepID=A0A919V3V4_9ACTN|nr:ATP-binding cassette domain-containing protein [Sphaerisporangium rufum]GII80503.1 hypothetical protein Sru01_54850 [Sphaerisporangium rufum]